MRNFFRRRALISATVALALGTALPLHAATGESEAVKPLAQTKEGASSFKKPIPLGFAKLIVADLDAMSRFYQALCGFEEEDRADARIGGRPIREVHFRSDPPGTGIFTLTKFLDSPRPAAQALILGFITTDIEQFVSRSTAAGGIVVEAVTPDPEHGVKYAFLRDIEGNLIEVVELL